MYKIKIEDTETGKVLVDEESNCIICVDYLPDENSAHCIAWRDRQTVRPSIGC